MSEETLLRDTLEVVLARLHESHDVSAYEAVDRLVHAGEEAGLDTDTLLRMLDQGISLQKLFDLIVSRAVSVAPIAPLQSKRRSEPTPPAQPEQVLDQLLVA